MKTKILNGTNYQNHEFGEILKQIETIRAESGQIPGIAFLAFVGHLSLMKYTIAIHEQAAKGLGFNVKVNTLPHLASKDEMIAIIEKLNQDDEIHAIVLLQPVPKHVDAINVIKNISRVKEIEGFHPDNVLKTLINGIHKTQYPMCLPMALENLFKNWSIEIKPGQEFVFIADQDFISNKFRNLILRTASSQVVPPDCSFTIVNSDNSRLKNICKNADFLFVISENPEFLDPAWLKPGVCIVDIYSNLIKEVKSKKNPDLMIPVIRGGVNTKSVMNIARSIAPCPGGIMPVLLAVLFRNALNAFKFQTYI